MWITNGSVADLLIVYARTGPEGSKGITAFLTEKEFKGYLTSELAFEDCFVPDSHVLGQVNKGV